MSKWRQWLGRLRGEPLRTDLRPYQRLLDRINRREAELLPLSDGNLQTLAGALREWARQGEPLDGLRIEFFALVREVARRRLGQRPFDVQVVAGLALHEGRVVEMQTGEGKTLAAVAPAALNALTGRGAHILTFNDYLARRDAGWMGPVYEFLGLSVGTIQEGMSSDERRRAYAADITYGTAKEIGFDFLRDQLVRAPEELRRRSFHCAIVDEADSLLIDEARVPLVIAGAAGDEAGQERRIADLVRMLRPAVDYETDEHGRNVFLTESGLERLERQLGCGPLHDAPNRDLLATINLAIQARALLRRDIDYIVRDDKVELVDEFTGRVADNRRWPDGLQAALEAKEGVSRQRDGRILGSITLQHFLRLYPKLAGMTATAAPAAEEIRTFYGLETLIVPPHKPCIREDLPDLIFPTQQAKEQALLAEIRRTHAAARPVLVGTASVAESERLAAALKDAGLDCRVLNAKNDEWEARIVADAGRPGAITISTNMAGRGTDIRLCEGVAERGGLYVIGTNRHESRRIDDQLRGRAGRQGDPGSSRFILSLEDELMQQYGLVELLPAAPLLSDTPFGDTPIDDPRASREIARAQRIIESENLSIRKMLYKYSVIVEEQRKIVQQRRDEALYGDSVSIPKNEIAQQEVERLVTLHHLEEIWSEHLAAVADIRESSYLTGLTRTNTWGMPADPIDAYLQQVNEAFATALTTLDERIVATMQRLAALPGGIDLARENLGAPSATWTYLVTDMPLGSGMERFFRGIKRKLLATLK